MKCIYSDAQEHHYPKSYLVNGVRQANPESPERISMLLEGVLAAGLNNRISSGLQSRAFAASTP